ncbi:serine/threonine protein kinase [Konateibacter massiliensis]|uniref:serine/threonine protein kinase n=1 Tax=Konateibacter massiliensis TaxID=2002841 RepID=UPI0015D4FF66|nr:serine/threonine-protein kinase [Konateibacter massiliensis]
MFLHIDVKQRSWCKLSNKVLFKAEAAYGFILFDRYFVEQQIGSGLSGKVYLARHIKLKAKRVIKCISKSETMYPQFLTEATLLKNLKHPGIPIIYDLEEDGEYLYIIEEYIQGESLKAILQSQNAISRENVIHFTTQICNVMEYLHNSKPYPILYLDLKPEHIIVCNDSVKIIDFGAAIYMEKEEADYSFGTPCFAAPEQFNSLKLDSKADIYAIGSILYFMLTGKNPPSSNSQKILFINLIYISADFKKIIIKCMARNPKNRYENVSQIKKELSMCKSQKNTLIIGITGSQPRIGVSHLAIGLVTFLNKSKRKTLLEERNQKGVLSYLNDENEKTIQKNGVIYRSHLTAIPYYNETISIQKDSYEIIVRDCGTFEEADASFYSSDIKIVVLGAKAWERQQARECMEKAANVEPLYVFNLCERGQAYEAAREMSMKRAWHVPLFSDPLANSKASEKAFRHMCRKEIFKKRRREKS